MEGPGREVAKESNFQLYSSFLHVIWFQFWNAKIWFEARKYDLEKWCENLIWDAKIRYETPKSDMRRQNPIWVAKIRFETRKSDLGNENAKNASVLLGHHSLVPADQWFLLSLPLASSPCLFFLTKETDRCWERGYPPPSPIHVRDEVVQPPKQVLIDLLAL